MEQLSGYGITRQLVLGELDTEIRVRERLREAVESRIAWATCLQSSLGAVAENQGPGPKLDSASANPFQLAAADALNVAEAPLLPILSRQARFPHRSFSDASPALSPSSAMNPYARPYTRHTRLRRSPSSIRTSPKFLYFRDASTNVLVRLTCPDCSRGDFPRVQSLLNHCRIQHGREFGSHDECIRGCAVQVPADEETWVIENGSELRQSGLPSLRRLFEIAVGGAGSPLGITSTNDTSTGQPVIGRGDDHFQEREISQDSTHIPLSSTHLSRTLGHHAESPALAPFLGRASKRRGIMTHDENTPVNIGGREEMLVRWRWHKPFIHRSRARPSLDIAIATPAETPASQCNPNIAPVTQGTRFHVVARVTISDRSLWIPADRRAPTSPDHTHQWLLCISAPTYSLPLGAILERATVTCMSPGTSPMDGPIEMSGPPFFAGGTTPEPFLARLRLEWTSGSLNPPLEVDHWVELDMLHAATPMLGDEQVLDVELDRHTMFRNVVDNPTQAPDTWALCHGSSRVQSEPAAAPPGYVVLLRSLVPKFPLTLRDMKSKVSATFPYKLVSSPTQFRALVPGRRKAIEWARARAVHEAYEETRKDKTPDDYPYLSTGDVFCWLADTGLSLRQAVPQFAPANASSGKKTSERITPSVANTFCATCGLEMARHSAAQSSSWEGPTSNGSCRHSFPMSRLPLLDVGPVSRVQSQNPPNGPVQSISDEKGSFPWSSREVLAATDPSLTIAVRCIVASLKLSCFPESHNTSISSAGVLRPNSTAITPMAGGSDVVVVRSDLNPISEPVSESLASSAVLALAVREFARRLVNSAVTAFASDGTRGKGATRAVLTPAHVSGGVAGSFLARDGVFRDLPPSPVTLALATLVHYPLRGSSPPSAFMDMSCGDSTSSVRSSSHNGFEERCGH